MRLHRLIALQHAIVLQYSEIASPFCEWFRPIFSSSLSSQMIVFGLQFVWRQTQLFRNNQRHKSRCILVWLSTYFLQSCLAMADGVVILLSADQLSSRKLHYDSRLFCQFFSSFTLHLIHVPTIFPGWENAQWYSLDWPIFLHVVVRTHDLCLSEEERKTMMRKLW